MLADDLSRNQCSSFLLKVPHADPHPSRSSPIAHGSASELAIPELDVLMGFYFEQGLSKSSHSTYKSGKNKFQEFCTTHNITSPFPISQSLLRYYITFLAKQKLAPSTIRVYVSALRHSQIALGFPAPAQAAMPKLKLISRDIARARDESQEAPPSKRLPITPSILAGICRCWNPCITDYNHIMLWAACTTAFFGFFHLGELTVPANSAFDPSCHLSPAEVAIDSSIVHP